jgi:hypothetical protein
MLQLWLKRLESFVKFLILISQSWKKVNSPYYDFCQNKFAGVITYAITFLYNEIQA